SSAYGHHRYLHSFPTRRSSDLKTGRKVGNDSLYYFDNVPDCESEGFIRFYDQANDLVGMLNSEGEIQIPAIYNGLGRVKNGMIPDRKSTRLNSSHVKISYAVFC